MNGWAKETIVPCLLPTVHNARRLINVVCMACLKEHVDMT